MPSISAGSATPVASPRSSPSRLALPHWILQQPVRWPPKAQQACCRSWIVAPEGARTLQHFPPACAAPEPPSPLAVSLRSSPTPPSSGSSVQTRCSPHSHPRPHLPAPSSHPSRLLSTPAGSFAIPRAALLGIQSRHGPCQSLGKSVQHQAVPSISAGSATPVASPRSSRYLSPTALRTAPFHPPMPLCFPRYRIPCTRFQSIFHSSSAAYVQFYLLLPESRPGNILLRREHIFPPVLDAQATVPPHSLQLLRSPHLSCAPLTRERPRSSAFCCGRG